MTIEHKYDYDLIVRLSKEGRTISQIMEEIGCSERVVTRARKAANLVIPREPVDVEARAAAMEKARYLLEEEEQSYPMVAEQTGLNVKTLKSHFPGHQWSATTRTQATAMQAAVKRLPDTLQRRAA